MILVEVEKLFAESRACVLVEITSVEGSTPRDQDAWMVVTESGQAGTIGGGQLEYLACQHAYKIIRSAESPGQDLETASLALGPELGQCCGGRVGLKFSLLDENDKQRFIQDLKEREKALPNILLFGAGHVGLALTRVLLTLPVHVSLIDTRKDYLETQLTSLGAFNANRLESHATALPEEIINKARPGSAYVIATHDHALDFLLARQALLRKDAALVGMIGSKTKLARLKSWLEGEGENPNLADSLICPIGGKTDSKRPEVIALATALEIFSAF